MNRPDLAGRIATVEHRMDSIERRWDASFAAFTTQILQSNRETRQEILATLRGEMEVSGGTLRGEMEVLGENLRSEMQTLGANLRGEMQTLGGNLRGEMETLGGTLRGEMETLDGELRGEMQTLGAKLRGEMHTLHGITVRRFEKLETALAEGDDETRRFMKILHEDTLNRIALLGEGWPPRGGAV